MSASDIRTAIYVPELGRVLGFISVVQAPYFATMDRHLSVICLLPNVVVYDAPFRFRHDLTKGGPDCYRWGLLQ